MTTIRTFEAFAGYGSQLMAMRRLEAAYPDQLKVIPVGYAEIDKYAIQAYTAVHGNVPNYGNICNIDWSQVPDFDLFTYSSPCQDFSQAGKQAGGEKGSGTRSSLLWECERAIREKRPKYLLMENVAALVSKKFVGLFNQWQLTLERYGYRNFPQVLNAKDYGVPQNRERIFLVSILDEGDHPRYEFPKPFRLDKRLKDLLEQNVEEKYYLSNVAIEGFDKHKTKCEQAGTGFGWQPTDGDTIGNAVLAAAQNRPSGNYIQEPKIESTGELMGGVWDKRHHHTRKVYHTNGVSPTLDTCGGGGTETKIVEPK